MLYLFISFQAQARHKNRVLPRKISAWNKKRPQTKVSGLFGGDKRDRTADLLNAIQALSQLSYTPKLFCCRQATKVIIAGEALFVNTLQQKNSIFFLCGIKWRESPLQQRRYVFCAADAKGNRVPFGDA